MAQAITFADITTMGVGGPIARFIEPDTRVGVIEAVEEADSRGLPLCVVGGGSNLLVGDAPFEGVVVRDARRAIMVPDEAAPVEGADRSVHVVAEAGCNWDDLVAFCVELGLSGVEGLSGIPGTVGASVVQNIGAYGQEVADSVVSVEVWDRLEKRTLELTAEQMCFGYRASALKTSMYEAPGVPAATMFPTPRYVVLSVTFRLVHCATGVVGYGQLANALGVELGERMDTRVIRDMVLAIRAAKGMLEDASRYELTAMAGAKREQQLVSALRAQRSLTDEQLLDRHSCGSFFMNPVLSLQEASRLPQDAPRFDAVRGDGTPGVKTSAAWLIDHAGFAKGYRVTPQARAALSSAHTLALTNRGNATADDVAQLAARVRDGVREVFGVSLVPEPVTVGVSW